MLAAALGSGAAPSEAAACSGCLEEVSDGQPADGAVDVPTDVQPWVRGVRVTGRSAPNAVLEDGTGRPVSTEVRALPSARGRAQCAPFDLEITPAAPLSPHTTYTLRVGGPDGGPDDVRVFTTGDGPSEDAVPAPPNPPIALFGPDQCGGPQACVGVARGVALELTVSHEGQVDQRYLASASHLATLSGATGQCFEARTRDLSGRRSSAAEICVDDLPAYDGLAMAALEAGCRVETDATDADASSTRAPDDGGDCAVHAPGRAPGAARSARPWLLALCALGVCRNRRASR
jgi:hypothetical protein